MPTMPRHATRRATLALACAAACLAIATGATAATPASTDTPTVAHTSSLFASVSEPSSDTHEFTTAPTSTGTATPTAATPNTASASPFPAFNIPGLEPRPAKLGVTARRLEFTTTQRDRSARRAAMLAEQLRNRSARHRAVADDATFRILAIKRLLDAAQQDEARLRELVQQRAVERYKDGGGSGDLAFLLEGDGISDLVDRAHVLGAQDARDRRAAEQLAVTTQRLDDLQMLLEDLRGQQGLRATALDDRAASLDGLVVAARSAHLEAPDPSAYAPDAGAEGRWYVTGGAFDVPLFVPITAGGWGGGTRTPRRSATAEQVARVLHDPRIELDASGINDVATMQIDGRLLDALSVLAQQFGHVRVTSLKSDHGVYTASGNVSEHSFGCAADIGTIGSTYISSGTQTPGGEVERAVRLLAALPGDLAPHQVISLFELGGPTMRLADHHDHIHLGYAC